MASGSWAFGHPLNNPFLQQNAAAHALASATLQAGGWRQGPPLQQPLQVWYQQQQHQQQQHQQQQHQQQQQQQAALAWHTLNTALPSWMPVVSTPAAVDPAAGTVNGVKQSLSGSGPTPPGASRQADASGIAEQAQEFLPPAKDCLMPLAGAAADICSFPQNMTFDAGAGKDKGDSGQDNTGTVIHLGSNNDGSNGAGNHGSNGNGTGGSNGVGSNANGTSNGSNGNGGSGNGNGGGGSNGNAGSGNGSIVNWIAGNASNGNGSGGNCDGSGGAQLGSGENASNANGSGGHANGCAGPVLGSNEVGSGGDGSGGNGSGENLLGSGGHGSNGNGSGGQAYGSSLAYTGFHFSGLPNSNVHAHLHYTGNGSTTVNGNGSSLAHNSFNGPSPFNAQSAQSQQMDGTLCSAWPSTAGSGYTNWPGNCRSAHTNWPAHPMHYMGGVSAPQPQQTIGSGNPFSQAAVLQTQLQQQLEGGATPPGVPAADQPPFQFNPMWQPPSWTAAAMAAAAAVAQGPWLYQNQFNVGQWGLGPQQWGQAAGGMYPQPAVQVGGINPNFVNQPFNQPFNTALCWQYLTAAATQPQNPVVMAGAALAYRALQQAMSDFNNQTRSPASDAASEESAKESPHIAHTAYAQATHAARSRQTASGDVDKGRMAEHCGSVSGSGSAGVPVRFKRQAGSDSEQDEASSRRKYQQSGCQANRVD